MNNDLISREALKKAIKELSNDNPSYWNTCDVVDREKVLDEIDNAPTVERPQGEWKVYGKQGGIPITDMCSNCRYEMKWYKNKYNFCPNCGAKMEGGAE